MMQFLAWMTFVCGTAAAMVSGVGAYVRYGPYGERLPEVEAHIRRLFDAESGELRVIAYDRNRNGRMDSWTYYDDAGRMMLTQADDDEDGVIDHWFEYDTSENVARMGTSTRGDGVVDAWRYDAPEGGTYRIDYYDHGTRVITRQEFFDKGALVRVEVPAHRPLKH